MEINEIVYKEKDLSKVLYGHIDDNKFSLQCSPESGKPHCTFLCADYVDANQQNDNSIRYLFDFPFLREKIDRGLSDLSQFEKFIGMFHYSFIPPDCSPTFYADYPSLRQFHLMFPMSADELTNVLSPYYDFYNAIESLNKNVHWNSLTIDNPEGIYLYNIQGGCRKFWKELEAKMFSLDKLANRYFLFYWQSNGDGIEGSNRDKSEWEVKDKLWSQSRFLRDFLMYHKKSFAIDLQIWQLKKEENNKNIEYSISQYRKANTEFSPMNIFNNVQKCISSSLRATYGNEFPNNYGINEISQFYLHNKVKNEFNSRQEQIEQQKKVVGREVSTNVGDHGILETKDNWLRSYSLEKKDFWEYLGIYDLWGHFYRTMSTLSSSIMWWSPDVKGEEILFIDDNPEKFESKISALYDWFPNSCFYSFNDLEPLVNNENHLKEKLKVIEYYRKGESLSKRYKEINLTDVDFLIIDLEYNNEEKGFEILHRLRSACKCTVKPNIITLSRREDPQSIQRALNSGALFYVAKAYFYDLVPNICQIRQLRNEYNVDFKLDDSEKARYSKYENWHLLSKLPLKKVIELQGHRIVGNEYVENPNLEIISKEENPFWEGAKYSNNYQWIKKLPKADIHCHIGSCMGADLLPQTALIVLSQLWKNDKFKNNIEKIITFLKPIATDPNLVESGNISLNTNDYVSEFSKAIEERNALKDQISTKEKDKNKSLYNLISDIPLVENKITHEEALLSPKETSIEREFGLNLKNSSYVRNKFALRQAQVSYDEVMLVFILLLHLRGISDRKKYDDWFLQLKGSIDDIIFKENCPDLNSDLNGFSKEWIDLIGIDQIKSNLFLEITALPLNENIIEQLQSAYFLRKISGNKSLFNYLRGCEYAGSAHLQTKASIILTAKYIVQDYAIPDNIRYLSLRCAVDGYSKLKLQSQEEAMETLLRAFDFYTVKACQINKTRLRVDLIVTAKRHKSITEFENNVRLALKYRNGLQLTKQNEPEGDKGNYFKAFPARTKVVSFDLAGLERGNRPSKFYNHFLPLLKECFPITIHAGEEDDAESIWEAVYLVQSQRLGHALTLNSNPDLMKLVKERHIAIELCPISNYLTKGEYKLRDFGSIEKWLPIGKNSYPLRQYLNENLDVTINTDNPFVSNSNITLEFLFAARLIDGLTKWEVLRLIKNGFRAAAIPKEEKRVLMNEIDDEIYEILLNED